MAASALIPKNGAVTYGALVWDYNAFSLEVAQSAEVITPYGTNTCSQHAGSGTPDFTANITAFALAHASSAAPVLGSSATIFSGGGAAAVLTFDTGCTESFTGILERMTISHARMRGAVPASMRLVNAGEVTEAWATS